MSGWASALTALGVTVALTERQHAVFLLAATAVALISAVARYRATRRWSPLLASAVGCVAIIASHVLGDFEPLALCGVATILVSTALDWWWTRSAPTRRLQEQTDV